MREVGLGGDRGGVARHRRCELLERSKRIPTIVEGFHGRRVKSNCLIAARERLIEALQLAKGKAAVTVGFRRIRFEGNRLIVARHRLAELPQPEKRIATSVKGGRKHWINCKGGIDMTNRLRVIPALMIDNPEEVLGVNMIGLILQYLPVH